MLATTDRQTLIKGMEATKHKEIVMRYQMVLVPCKATNKEYWGKSLASAPSILSLWDQVGWRASDRLSHDQEIKVVDTKNNKEMTEQEYGDLVRQLKGW